MARKKCIGCRDNLPVYDGFHILPLPTIGAKFRCPNAPVREKHHPWCNRFLMPREGCKMCEEAYQKYPVNGLTSNELMAKHFPDNVKVR